MIRELKILSEIVCSFIENNSSSKDEVFDYFLELPIYIERYLYSHDPKTLKDLIDVHLDDKFIEDMKIGLKELRGNIKDDYY